MAAFLAGGLLAASYISAKNREALRFRVAVEQAKSHSLALAQFRMVYAVEVVSKAREHGFEITDDYKNRVKAIPPPATLSMMLGKRLGEASGISSALYSPYPFPRRREGGLTDDFRREAWRALNANPDESFYKLETIDGGRVLRFATADRMGAACVECHNSHPESPKRGWKDGDVRGVLEVRLPMDTFDALGSAVWKGDLCILAIFGLMAFAAFVLVLRRSQRTSLELGELVERRTGDVLEAQDRLKAESEARMKLEEQRRLGQKIEAIGQLAAGIAHEINTPIQFVGDSVHFLRDATTQLVGSVAHGQKLAAAARKDGVYADITMAMEQEEKAGDLDFVLAETPAAIDRALEGVGRVAKIVRSMKEFAHPDRDEQVPSDMNHLLNTTLTICKNEYKYIADVETDFGELPMVPCHVGELNQVFLNIIVNAAHAIQDKNRGDGARGTIRIRTSVDGTEAVIAIADTGCGIPASIIERIYDPFFTTKEVGRGSGQGLAIAHSIVVGKHKGELAVQSEVGKGSTFIIRLPVDGTLSTHSACSEEQATVAATATRA